MTTIVDTTVAIIQSAQQHSANCWEMAADTADNAARAAEYEADAERCDALYDATIEAVEIGDFETAAEKIEEARKVESDGGDDGPARKASAAIERAKHVYEYGSGDGSMDDPQWQADDAAYVRAATRG